MNLHNKNLLILLNTGWLDDKAIEYKAECVCVILQAIETPQQFCTAFELVNRNTITSKPKIILRESKHLRLRPFRFLINKN